MNIELLISLILLGFGILILALWRFFSGTRRESGEKNLEIERKFVLKDVPEFLGKEINKIIILQIYIDEGDRITRYRMSQEVISGDIAYVKCNKKKISDGVFEEIESFISGKDFEDMLKFPHREIIKTRYVYEEGGLKWEVDKYKGMKLVVMEVELEDIKQKIKIPECIKDYVIADVTGIEGFSNYKLSTIGKY